jgi:hypothetical protein
MRKSCDYVEPSGGIYRVVLGIPRTGSQEWTRSNRGSYTSIVRESEKEPECGLTGQVFKVSFLVGAVGIDCKQRSFEAQLGLLSN